MGTTPTPRLPEPLISRTPAGTLLIADGGERIEVSLDVADQLAYALREAVYVHAPEMERVIGLPDAAPRGSKPEYGLACPHPGCSYVVWAGTHPGVIVVEYDERWSTFGYVRDPQHQFPDGRVGVAEWVRGTYRDSDPEGLGYRCLGCGLPVALPEGVTEEGC